MTTEPTPPPLVMLGASDAAVCEDDSCLLPGAAPSAATPHAEGDSTPEDARS